MADECDPRRIWEAALAGAGVALPATDAATAWDEARRLASAARRIRERADGGR